MATGHAIVMAKHTVSEAPNGASFILRCPRAGRRSVRPLNACVTHNRKSPGILAPMAVVSAVTTLHSRWRHGFVDSRWAPHV